MAAFFVLFISSCAIIQMNVVNSEEVLSTQPKGNSPQTSSENSQQYNTNGYQQPAPRANDGQQYYLNGNSPQTLPADGLQHGKTDVISRPVYPPLFQSSVPMHYQNRYVYYPDGYVYYSNGYPSYQPAYVGPYPGQQYVLKYSITGDGSNKNRGYERGYEANVDLGRNRQHAKGEAGVHSFSEIQPGERLDINAGREQEPPKNHTNDGEYISTDGKGGVQLAIGKNKGVRVSVGINRGSVNVYREVK